MSERLTKNGKYGNYEPIKPSNLYPAIDKLGQLEDIEEELGIGLELNTILKTLLQDKIYFFSNKTKKIEYKTPTARSLKNKSIIFAFDDTIVEYKDYGKTWALTREELL